MDQWLRNKKIVIIVSSPVLGFLLTSFRQELEKLGLAANWNSIMVKNPASLFEFSNMRK